MDSNAIMLILTALEAGAAASTKDIAGTAIKDAYQALKELLKQKFAGEPKAGAALIDHEEDPETYELPLKKALTKAQADQDEAIMKLAREIVDQAQTIGLVANVQQKAVGDHIIQVGGNFTGGYANIGDSSSVQHMIPKQQHSPAQETK